MDRSLPVEPDAVPKVFLKENDFVPFFIYKRYTVFDVLHYKQAAQSHNSLINSGWKHIATIEPLQWIESLLNDDMPSRFLHHFMQEGDGR